MRNAMLWGVLAAAALGVVCGAIPVYAWSEARETVGANPTVNWDQIQAKWTQFRGQVRQKWGKLTDNDLERIAGKRDELVGRIQERYAVDKAQAEKEVEEFVDSLSQAPSEPR